MAQGPCVKCNHVTIQVIFCYKGKNLMLMCVLYLMRSTEVGSEWLSMIKIGLNASIIAKLID